MLGSLPSLAQQPCPTSSCINTVINGIDFSKLTADQIGTYLKQLSPEQLGGFIGQLDPGALTVFLGRLPDGALNNIVNALPAEAVQQFYNFLPAEGKIFVASSLTNEDALQKIGLDADSRAALLEASQELRDAQATDDPVLIALALANLARQPGGEFAGPLLDQAMASLSPEQANDLFFLADGDDLDALVSFASEDTLDGIAEVLEAGVWANVLSEANEDLFSNLVESFTAEDLAFFLPLMIDGQDIALLLQSYEGMIELVDLAALLEALPDYVVAELLVEIEAEELLSALLGELGIESVADYLEALGADPELAQFFLAGLDADELAELVADAELFGVLASDAEALEAFSALADSILEDEGQNGDDAEGEGQNGDDAEGEGEGEGGG
jgi:hypothetical protein